MAKRTSDLSRMSAEQRLALIGEIWDSLDAEQPPLDEEFLAELERRRAELETHPEDGIPAAEVLARIRARLK